MAANLTVAANKRVRGEILALLYSVQPVPVEIRTITNSLLESIISQSCFWGIR